MATIKIEGVPAFDGEYELDLQGQPFSGWDAHLIYQVAGIGLAELDESGRKGIYDVVVALTVIALQRTGKVQRSNWRYAVDVLLEAPIGSIAYLDEGDAGPPEQTPNETGSDDSQEPSGPSTNHSSENQDDILTPIGHPV
jgi:hypothetical protein